MIKVYGYTSCTTVRNSMKFLEENNLEYSFFDFVKKQIAEDTLRDLILRSNKEIDLFFNKNGKLFKELALKDKLPTLSYDEKVS
ncbi:hypothetical protein LJB88_04855, partial [Erysipelotrichaceae bacterium OttesenSCG-928-M19]|nr:hypothetical protein [Erysipelotrichaceae bacterium OttesenSCG-928-M19]